MKKIYRLLVLFILMNSNVYSQMTFENKYYEFPIEISYGYYQRSPTFEGFITQGWYKLIPGQKIDMPFPFAGNNGTVFYTINPTDGYKMVHSDGNLLVDPTNAFNIINADKLYMKRENPTYEFRKFKRVDMNFTTKSINNHYILDVTF